jgi:hypothetical protein
MTLENCKNIYSWLWFLAVARKLVLVSIATVAKRSVLWLKNSGLA